MPGIVAQHCAVSLFRSRQVAQFLKHLAEIAAGARKVRLETQGRLVMLDGIAETALLVTRPA